MQKHTKIYMNHFGYGEQDFIPCENCGSECIDVHHIYGRGPGKDVIENLMGLCRGCYDWAHLDTNFNEQMKAIHLKRINQTI